MTVYVVPVLMTTFSKFLIRCRIFHVCLLKEKHHLKIVGPQRRIAGHTTNLNFEKVLVVNIFLFIDKIN